MPTYDFAGITNPSATHVARFASAAGADPTGPGDGLELTTMDYAMIELEDGTDYAIGVGLPGIHWTSWTMLIAEPDVSALEFRWVGNIDDDDDPGLVYRRFDAWNYTLAQWDLLANLPNEPLPPVVHTYSTAGDAMDYVDGSGHVCAIARISTPGICTLGVRTDYFRLTTTVTSGTPQTHRLMRSIGLPIKTRGPWGGPDHRAW